MPRTSDALVRAREPTVLDLTLARPGTITGSIIDPDADAALEGVEVHLLDSQGHNVAMRLTDDQGEFSFASVRAGAYTVQPVAPVGYVLNEPPAGVTIGPRESRAVEFTMRPGGVVKGRVVDEHTGEPLAGVAVALLDAEGRELRRATTTSNGEYEFVNLPEDRYRVSVLDES